MPFTFPNLSPSDLKELPQPQLLKLIIEADWAVYEKASIPFGGVQWDRCDLLLNFGVALLSEQGKAAYEKYEEDPYGYKLGCCELLAAFADTSDMTEEEEYWFWEGLNQRSNK